MTQSFSVVRDDEIAVVTIDRPFVHGSCLQPCERLTHALGELRDDPKVQAIVLVCLGRKLAGADVAEFGTPPQPLALRGMIAALESTGKPTVAAIRGCAVGDVLELVLGCHFRVADAGAEFGLPHVKLGTLPCAGGTLRLPRLVGATEGLKMIVSGVSVGARHALESGLLDAIFVADLQENAVAFARRKVTAGDRSVPVRERDERLSEARKNMPAFDAVVAEATKKARGLDAPIRCAQSVRNGLTMAFEEALAKEYDYFLELVSGDQSRAQRHVFVAEREATTVTGVTIDARPRPIKKIGVIGAGTMGGGIAMSFANGGFPVTVLETTREALDRGLGMVEKNYAISVSRGSITQEAKARRSSLITGTTDYASLADCDLVVEAVFEEMMVKKAVFSRLDDVAKPGAILATNTSFLDVDEIASSTARSKDVVGTHFFSPANVMRLLEIVRGKATAPDVLATLLDVAGRIGKVPVVVGVCHGFVGNRMLLARSAEVETLLLEGATPAEVDKAFTDFGWPMGPFQMEDLAGQDVGWRNRKAFGGKAAISDLLCEMGRFGQKTGRGFYLYEEGSRRPKADPEVEQLIERQARKCGINRRPILPQEIIERTHYPMINEGARILEEGIAERASDIDVVWINGYGYPLAKGGPMFWADRVGLPSIVERLEYWRGQTGRDDFEPAPLLKQLARDGRGFSGQKIVQAS